MVRPIEINIEITHTLKLQIGRYPKLPKTEEKYQNRVW